MNIIERLYIKKLLQKTRDKIIIKKKYYNNKPTRTPEVKTNLKKLDEEHLVINKILKEWVD